MRNRTARKDERRFHRIWLTPAQFFLLMRTGESPVQLTAKAKTVSALSVNGLADVSIIGAPGARNGTEKLLCQIRRTDRGYDYLHEIKRKIFSGIAWLIPVLISVAALLQTL